MENGKSIKRQYDREFKSEILRLIKEEGHSVAQVARDFGIRDSLIYKWRKALREEPQEPLPGKGNLRKEEVYVRQLEKDLKRGLPKNGVS
ncbi:transposase [Thermatribacter velox]|uniref:Transposase n=1 Tax=Thermatribacter velox TaxID=3039681 RepID=A0ABZ2YAS8_9BACT